jgi:hypothetical protein
MSNPYQPPVWAEVIEPQKKRSGCLIALLCVTGFFLATVLFFLAVMVYGGVMFCIEYPDA